MTTVDLVSLISSVVSISLGGVAIWLSLHFYSKGRQTETNVSNSLTEIRTQAEILQKLTYKQVDKLTKFVITQKGNHLEDSLPQFITMLNSIPHQLLQQNIPHQEREELLKEITVLYSVLYYYTAQTNYWAQFYLPPIEDYREEDSFHTLTKRIIDASSSDFDVVDNTLSKLNIESIKGTAPYILMTETKEFWRNYVKSSTTVFAEINKQKS